MKRTPAVIVGLVALLLANVWCVSADEVTSGGGNHLRYAKIGPSVAPFKVPPYEPPPQSAAQPSAFPVELTLAQAPLTKSSKETKSRRAFSLFESTGERFADTITVFGERIVPPAEVSGLEHVEFRTFRTASDEFQWTFWKVRGASGKPLFGTDLIIQYRYPTEGSAPRGFRSGDFIVGLALNIPLGRFYPSTSGTVFALR